MGFWRVTREEREQKAVAKLVSDASEPIWTGVVDTDVTVEFAHPVDLVWARFNRPDFVLHEFVVFKGRVEGSPRGVGEISVSIHEVAGRRHVHTSETIEFEEGRRIAYSELPNHDAGVVSSRYEYDFKPVGDGSCVVRYRGATEIRARQSLADRLRSGLGRQVETGLLALSATLDHEALATEAPGDQDVEFCLEVEEVFTITDRGTAIIGVIQSGTVSTGDQLQNESRDDAPPASVDEIDAAPRTSRTVADARPRIGIVISGWTPQDVQPGDVLTTVTR